MRRVGVLAVLFLLLASRASAQFETASVVGTALDKTGGVIGGAKVTLTNTGTGVSVEQITDKDGNYELVLLKVGKEQRKRPYLKMQNASVPELWHVEGVPPNITTVQEAHHWRNQTPQKPTILT